MSRIYSLSNETINKIAAGEVIESPASCIKELVENAIDAKPTDIRISIQDSGFRSLTISDNGIGMSREDMHRCIQRHATSKIKSADDLFSIHTMGFRGEALAAISSISKMRITSCDTSEGAGLSIEFEGGEIQSEKPTAFERGTRVDVEDLFFNTPVRKAFQKSKASELGKIVKLVRKLALSHPDITFTLESEGDVLMQATALSKDLTNDPLADRILELFDTEYLKNSIKIDIDLPHIRLKGYVQDPSFSNPTRLKEYLFLNRRAVECRLISEAIYEGLSVSLPEGRYPGFCLHLEIDPGQVDVNIHPQKKEVKLKSPSKIKEAIASGVSSALSTKAKKAFTTLEPNAIESTYQLSKPPSEFALERPEPATFQSTELTFDNSQIRLIDAIIVGSIAVLDIEVGYTRLQPAILCDIKALVRAKTYALLIDQKAVMEKRLISKTLSLSPESIRFIEKNKSLFSELGCSIRRVSPTTVLIDEAPMLIDDTLLEDLIELTIENAMHRSDGSSNIENIQKMIARKLAKNSSLHLPKSREDKRRYIEEAIKEPLPIFCPEKKPLFVYINEEDIEKLLEPNRALQLPNECTL